MRPRKQVRRRVIVGVLLASSAMLSGCTWSVTPRAGVRPAAGPSSSAAALPSLSGLALRRTPTSPAQPPAPPLIAPTTTRAFFDYVDQLGFVDASHGWELRSSCTPDTGVSACQQRVFTTGDAGRSWAQASGNLPPSQRMSFVTPQRGWAWRPARCPVVNVECAGELVVTSDGGGSWHVPEGLPRDGASYAEDAAGDRLLGTSTCTQGDCRGAVWWWSRGAWQRLATFAGGVKAVSLDDGLWAVTAGGAGAYQYRGEVWRSATPAADWHPLGDLVAMGGPADVDATVTVESPTAAWVSLLSRDGCAMHGCGGTGLWHAGIDGLRQVEVPTAGDECGYNNAPLVAHRPGGTLTAVTTTPLAGCGPPDAALVTISSAHVLGVVHRWAIGAPTSLAWLTDTHGFAVVSGLVEETHDAGAHWTAVQMPPPRQPDFVDDDAGFGVAGDNTIVRTDDGGATWTPVGTLADFVGGVQFSDHLHGYAFATSVLVRRADLWRTGDGGRTWALVPLPAPPAGGIQRELPGAIGTMAATTVLTCEGSEWQPDCTSPVTVLLGAPSHWRRRGLLVGPAGSEVVPAVGPRRLWEAISEVDAATPRVRLLTSTDEGASWRATTPPPTGQPTAVVAVCPVGDRGVAVLAGVGASGTTELWTSRDAGTTWQQRPLPRGAQAATVAWLPDAHGWVTGAGHLWATGDAGRHWQQLG